MCRSRTGNSREHQCFTQLVQPRPSRRSGQADRAQKRPPEQRRASSIQGAPNATSEYCRRAEQRIVGPTTTHRVIVMHVIVTAATGCPVSTICGAASSDRPARRARIFALDPGHELEREMCADTVRLDLGMDRTVGGGIPSRASDLPGARRPGSLDGREKQLESTSCDRGRRSWLSPHSLRHSFITAAPDAGVRLRDVQDATSDADPRTTISCDRAVALDRHATDIVSTCSAGATWQVEPIALPPGRQSRAGESTATADRAAVPGLSRGLETSLPGLLGAVTIDRSCWNWSRSGRAQDRLAGTCRGLRTAQSCRNVWRTACIPSIPFRS